MTTKPNRSLGILGFLLLFCATGLGQQKKVLVFTKTKGYAHASIPAGVRAIQEIGKTLQIGVDTTSNVDDFTEGNLKKYSALVFISTNPGILNDEQKTQMKRFIQAGGGFLGVHGASAGARDWLWYIELVGASFINHPEPKEGLLMRVDADNPASIPFPDHMFWKDEWYNFTKIQDGLHLLLAVDQASYVGGENNRMHPIAWYREFDGGRSFYTALGHFSYHFTDAFFVEHLTEGLKYVVGNAPLDYTKATAAQP